MATFLNRIGLANDAMPQSGVLLWAYDQARDQPWICMGLFAPAQADVLRDKLATAWASRPSSCPSIGTPRCPRPRRRA